MADRVTTKVVYDGKRRFTTHLTNESDGTGETSAVIKINVSDYTNADGETATYMTIDVIEYSVSGFNDITLYWDANTDDEIAVLKGQGVMDWTAFGGITDPKSTGTTGDLTLLTDGGINGSSYDITIHARLK